MVTVKVPKPSLPAEKQATSLSVQPKVLTAPPPSVLQAESTSQFPVGVGPPEPGVEPFLSQHNTSMVPHEAGRDNGNSAAAAARAVAVTHAPRTRVRRGARARRTRLLHMIAPSARTVKWPSVAGPKSLSD